MVPDTQPQCVLCEDMSHSRLSPDAEARVQLEYRRNVRSSTDPFKRAVYCLLGRCDNNENHSQVIAKTEDYMWLKVWSLCYCHLHFVVCSCIKSISNLLNPHT